MIEERVRGQLGSGLPESGEPQCTAPGDVAPDAVRAQLERILSSDLLKGSPQLSRFLTYVVTDTLDSQGSGLKEYEIARKVLNKPADFDVRLDPILCVEARRLRAAREGGFWRFSVSDRGVGFPPEYAHSVFDLFTRLHSMRSGTNGHSARVGAGE